ncbi:MAG TPA: AraC family transcriptional regulator [Opitutaceae bacterium]|nr:AraC family transcriptional regulator [Opitutaceae bacterium]
MAPRPLFRSEPLIQSPLRTALGDIELAGTLQNVAGIDPSRMRILRRFAFILMIEGDGYYRDAAGTERDLVPGDVVVVFPELAHAYGPIKDDKWTQLYFVVQGPQFELWREQKVLRPEHPVLRLGSPDYWSHRLVDVVKGEGLQTGAGPLRAMGRLLQVLAEMVAADADHHSRPSHEAWLEKSLHLLGDQGEGAWPSPQAVAKVVGMNYENFRKRFAQLMGESPGRYQKRRRVEWACAAMYQGEQSLKQIADNLGFCDVFHFSKAFKQETAMTPSEYRRRVRGI